MLPNRYLFLLATSLLFFLSCSEEKIQPPVVPELPERTVIAYLCGDNDLSSEISEKIDALQQGMKNMGETDNHLIVYADYRDQMPELSEITETGVKSLEQYAERNSASSANFSDVLQQVMQDFPAKSYGLICFSHASGWLPQGALNNPGRFVNKSSSAVLRSVFEDNGYEMPLSEFADAIPLTPTGEKFKFILFETCYMAGAEVAYALRNKTEWILASAAEMLSPGWVDIYPSQLAGLFLPEPPLKDFAQAYFDYRNNQTGASGSATISLIRPDKMEELANAVKALRSNASTVDVSNIQPFNRNVYHLFFDLSDYVEALADSNQLTDYENALSEVVVYQAATPLFMPGYQYSFMISKHCGLTTYIEQPQFPDLNQAWEQTEWGRALQ